MKISVITVCFNSGSSIASTLDSMATQTYSQIEHIVIDGGSTDNTLAIVRERGKHVTQLVSEPDKGIYDAMNKGLRLATGDFVGFLNADDMLASPDVLANIAAIASARSADVVYGDLLYVDKDQPDRLIRYWRSGQCSVGRLRFGWMPPHPTFYVRRSLQAAVGEFDPSLRIAADYDFMLRCLTRATTRVAYQPQVLVHMRTGGASNRSLAAIRAKSREDLFVLRKNRVGGYLTLLCKNLRKLPQFLRRSVPLA